jgi:UDP-GlcNAc:undecaprenyl-phosphate GlcNAc-1-phosphate transferase
VWLAVALLAFVAGLVLSGALTPVAARLAEKAGVVRWPGGRHVHERPTPLWGGLAMYVAFWGALGIGIAAAPSSLGSLGGRLWGVALGSLLLVVVSAYDDWRPLPAAPRLCVHFLAAAIAFAGGARIDMLTHPFVPQTPIYLGLVPSAIATILWIVVLINALNWIDGLDGLAGGVTAIVGCTLTVLALLYLQTTGAAIVALGGAALVGACLGFLKYNFSPARVFMGDAGAMFLGYALACLSVLGAFKTATALSFGIPLIVFSPIWGDAVRTFFLRIWRGSSTMAADQGHWHHRLLHRGLTKQAAVVRIYLWTALACACAIGLFAVLR